MPRAHPLRCRDTALHLASFSLLGSSIVVTVSSSVVAITLPVFPMFRTRYPDWTRETTSCSFITLDLQPYVLIMTDAEITYFFWLE